MGSSPRLLCASLSKVASFSTFPFVLCGLMWRTLLFILQVKQVKREHLKIYISFKKYLGWNSLLTSENRKCVCTSQNCGLRMGSRLGFTG